MRGVGIVEAGRRETMGGMRRVGVRRVVFVVGGKGVALKTVELRWAARNLVGVRGDEGLCLRGDGGEDAFLIEAHTVGAAAVCGSVKAGASYL